jgi:hypothetical protein
MIPHDQNVFIDQVRLATIVEKLQSHDRSGMDDLRAIFASGIRCVLARRVAPTDIEATLEKVLNSVAGIVGCREKSNPDQLPALVLSCVREVCGSQTKSRVEAMKQVLGRLAINEREALRRYYKLEQMPSEIHREAGLPEAALSALKSRVKNSFAALQRRPPNMQNVPNETEAVESGTAA